MSRTQADSKLKKNSKFIRLKYMFMETIVGTFSQSLWNSQIHGIKDIDVRDIEIQIVSLLFPLSISLIFFSIFSCIHLPPFLSLSPLSICLFLSRGSLPCFSLSLSLICFPRVSLYLSLLLVFSLFFFLFYFKLFLL